jgi:hypothetical protein
VRTCCCLTVHTYLALQRSRCPDPKHNSGRWSPLRFCRPGAIPEQASTITGTTTLSYTFAAHRCPLVAGTMPATRTASSSQLLSSITLAKSGHPHRPSCIQTASLRGSRRRAAFGELLHGAGHPEPDRSLMFRAPICRVDLLTEAFSSY